MSPSFCCVQLRQISPPHRAFRKRTRLFEISLQEALQRLAVSGFVARHLMDGVVDRVEIQRLRALCKVRLARGRAVFGFHAHFEVASLRSAEKT